MSNVSYSAYDSYDLWWRQPKDNAHKSVFSYVNTLRNRQFETEARIEKQAQLYMNRDVGLEPGQFKDYRNPSGNYSTRGDRVDKFKRINLNVVRSAVDTEMAKMALHRVRVRIITNNGSWHDHTKAKGMQKFIDGMFDELNIHKQMEQHVNVDSAVFGDGFIRIWADNKENKIMAEWQARKEFIIDEQASLYAKPRDMFQSKNVASYHLAAKFMKNGKPTEKSAAVEASAKSPDNYTTSGSISPLTEVIQAWHLPSSKEAKDGRYIMCVSNATLVDEPWNDDYPFVNFKWNVPPVGYWGQGLAEEIEPFQDEITDVLQKIQRAIYFHSVPTVLKPMGADVPDTFLTNEEKNVITFKGSTPPTVNMPEVVPPQIMQYPFILKQEAYNNSGVSSMEAQSETPQYQMSGRAIRSLKSISDMRFAAKERNREEAYVEIATRLIAVIRDSRTSSKIKTKYKKKIGGFESIYWKDVELPDDDYVIQAFPTSTLPREPSAKMQYVQELIQMGWLDPDLGIDLLDLPDIERVQSIKLAAIRNAQWVCDEILYYDRWHDPDPIMDLQAAISWCRSTYLYAQQMGAPLDKLEKLADWMAAAKDVLEQQTLAEVNNEAKMQAKMQMVTAPPQEVGLVPGAVPGQAEPAPGMEAAPGELPSDMVVPPEGMPQA